MRIFKAHMIGPIEAGKTIHVNVAHITHWHEETNSWEKPDGMFEHESYTRLYVTGGQSYYTEIKASLLGAVLSGIK